MTLNSLSDEANLPQTANKRMQRYEMGRVVAAHFEPDARRSHPLSHETTISGTDVVCTIVAESCEILMNIAAKMTGQKIDSIFAHDTGARSKTPKEYPYYTHYIRTNSGVFAEFGFCSIEEREQVPGDAMPISLGQGHRIAGIYEFADPDDRIRDPLYELVFVVTEHLEAIYDNFTENGNGLVSMAWTTIVELDAGGNPEWDWATNRMTDLSTGQIIKRERLKLDIESSIKVSKMSDGGIG